MPYRTQRGRLERASSIGHVPIVENELVQERLREYRIHANQVDVEIDERLVHDADSLGASSREVRWVLSFDGSQQEVAAREEYPSTRIGYVQVAGVLVDVASMLSQTDDRFVDPRVVRDATEEALHSMVLPGSNVCRPDMPTVRESWRAEIYDIFCGYSVEGISLLDIFMVLVRHSDKQSQTGGIILARCPSSNDCAARDFDVPTGGGTCPECGARVFPTDALRIHEEVSDEHGNATALGRLMTVLEQITMVGYIHFLSNRQPRALAHACFVLDGPLALFGPQAWLHVPIRTFLAEVSAALAQRQIPEVLLLGIEKSGQFGEHGHAISDRIENRQLMVLPDDYIYRHILTFRSSPNTAFGRDTYYGQKFYYKTAQGHLLTLTIPQVTGEVDDRHSVAHYPFLPEVLSSRSDRHKPVRGRRDSRRVGPFIRIDSASDRVESADPVGAARVGVRLNSFQSPLASSSRFLISSTIGLAASIRLCIDAASYCLGSP